MLDSKLLNLLEYYVERGIRAVSNEMYASPDYYRVDDFNKEYNNTRAVRALIDWLKADMPAQRLVCQNTLTALK